MNNKKEKVIVAKSEKDRRGTDRILNVRCIASSLFVCIKPELFMYPREYTKITLASEFLALSDSIFLFLLD